MADIQPSEVLNDPEFWRLPREERRKVMLEVDSQDFGGLPEEEQWKVVDARLGESAASSLVPAHPSTVPDVPYMRRFKAMVARGIPAAEAQKEIAAEGEANELARGLAEQAQTPGGKVVETVNRGLGVLDVPTERVQQAFENIPKELPINPETMAKYPTVGPLAQAASQAVYGTAREGAHVLASMAADPKNLPFMLAGLAGPGAVRPALRAATDALFTTLQEKGAIDDALSGNWTSAGVQQGFALLGLAGLSGELKGQILESVREKAKTQTEAPRTIERTRPAETPQPQAPVSEEAPLSAAPGLKGRIVAVTHDGLPVIKRTAPLPEGYELASETGIPAGPSARTAGETGEGRAAVPLTQLTESIRSATEGVKPSEVTGAASERLLETRGAVSGALARVKAAASDLWTRYAQPPVESDFRTALGKFSGDVQRANFSNREFAKAIQKAIPDKLRREAMTNWIQADGSDAVLQDRAARSTGRIKQGYELAMQLTPEEQTIARNISNHLDEMLERGIKAGVLEGGVENYVNQLWSRQNPVTKNLLSEVQEGKLQPNFRYAKRRIFNSYFEGEQAGFKPADKDIGFLISAYDSAFERALASRGMIASLLTAKSSDGRPLVAASGKGIPVGGEGGAHLIRPNVKPSAVRDYKPVDYPALKKWTWVGSTAEGKPILLQGDLVVHPEVYEHLSNVLGKSWFQTSPSPLAKVGRAALKAGGIYKRTLLSLSGFHMTQEGLHAEAHRINPIAPPKIDVNDSVTGELLNRGLVISGDRAGMRQFQEGLTSAGLVGKIPGIGKIATRYESWLFEDYIPRLKVAVGRAMFERNLKRYGEELSRAQIAELSANESNAAFGELNYDMMGRNKTVQDLLRLTLLAPDFLEARARFVGQALKPYGSEQLHALLFQATQLYLAARVVNQVLEGDAHWDKPFSVIYKGRQYDLRTISGDIYHLINDPRSFGYYRLNPALLKPVLEALTGRDAWGRRKGPAAQLEEFLLGAAPIPLQGTLGLGRDADMLESLMASIGGHERRFRTEAESLAEEYARDYYPSAEKTPEAEAKGRTISKLLREAREGNLTKSQLHYRARAAGLSPYEVARLGVRAETPSLLQNFRALPIDKSLDVWNHSNALERRALRSSLNQKVNNARAKMSPADRAQLNVRVAKALKTEPWQSFLPMIGKRITTWVRK